MRNINRRKNTFAVMVFCYMLFSVSCMANEYREDTVVQFYTKDKIVYRVGIISDEFSGLTDNIELEEGILFTATFAIRD